MFDAEKRKKWANRAEIAHTYSSLTLMVSGISRGVFPLINNEAISSSKHYELFHGIAVGVVFVAAVVMFISWIAKRRIGPSAAWSTLQALCNKLHNEIFSEYINNNDLLDDHRVTLFRYQKRSWRALINNELGLSWWQRLRHFNRGWLVPVIRSGDASRGTNSLFRVSKDGRAAQFEGVAGQAWGRSKAISVANLPMINHTSKSEHVFEYAKKTFMTVERLNSCIQNNKQLARSFWAHRLIKRGGVTWGVIVLDSKSSNEINEEAVTTAFKWISEAAAELLKEVS